MARLDGSAATAALLGLIAAHGGVPALPLQLLRALSAAGAGQAHAGSRLHDASCVPSSPTPAPDPAAACTGLGPGLGLGRYLLEVALGLPPPFRCSRLLLQLLLPAGLLLLPAGVPSGQQPVTQLASVGVGCGGGGGDGGREAGMAQAVARHAAALAAALPLALAPHALLALRQMGRACPPTLHGRLQAEATSALLALASAPSGHGSALVRGTGADGAAVSPPGEQRVVRAAATGSAGAGGGSGTQEEEGSDDDDDIILLQPRASSSSSRRKAAQPAGSASSGRLESDHRAAANGQDASAGDSDGGTSVPLVDDEQLPAWRLALRVSPEHARAVIESIRLQEFGVGVEAPPEVAAVLGRQAARLQRAMARLAADLYSSRLHLLLELLQNCDDCR